MPGSNGNGEALTYGVQSRTSSSDSGTPPPSRGSGFDFSGVLGTVLGNGIGFLRDVWAYNKNKQLEERRHQWNIEDWQRQNDYNSPAAMMARLAQAGINPNLITGEPTAASISPTSAGSGASSSGHGDVSALLPGIQARANIELTKSQIRLQDAQAKDLEASARQRDADVGYRGQEIGLKGQELEISRSLAASKINVDTATVKHLAKDVEQLQSLVELHNADRDLKTAQRNWEDMSRDARISMIKAQTKQFISSANLSDAEADRISRLVETELYLMQRQASYVDFQGRNEQFDLIQQTLDDPLARKVFYEIRSTGHTSPSTALRIATSVTRQVASQIRGHGS